MNALDGDWAAALEDFNAALELNARLKTPKINLARLGSDSDPNAWKNVAVIDYTRNTMFCR